MRSRKRAAMIGVLALIAGSVALGIDPPSEKTPPVPTSLPNVVQAGALIPLVNNEAAPAPLPRPEAAVSLEWSGPATIKVNQAAVYTLSVRNTSLQFVQKVTVQVRAGKHATIKETTPTAKVVEGVQLWELGTLEPRESRDLKLTIVQSEKGELGCQAWVTFTGTAGMKVQVREPRLSATLEVPPTVLVGENIPVHTTIKNIGDCDVGLIRYELRSTPGQERIGVDSGLAVGLSKRADFLDTATTPGVIQYELLAIGDDVAKVVAKAQVQVLQPKLSVSIDGPGEVMLNRKATYTLRVTNTGDVPTYRNELQWELPAELASGLATRTGQVALPKLEPGQTHETPLVLTARKAGFMALQARAIGSQWRNAPKVDQPFSTTHGEARKNVTVQGVPALRMELVDTVDPVERGSETTYEIRITNTGSRSDNNIVVKCPLPEQLKLVRASGPVGHTVQDLNNCAVITFEPVRELAPKTEAVFRITVKAVQNGDVRFKAMLNSFHLSTSVVKEESTRVYGE